MAQFPWKKGKKTIVVTPPVERFSPRTLGRKGRPFEDEAILPEMAIKGKAYVKPRRYRNA